MRQALLHGSVWQRLPIILSRGRCRGADGLGLETFVCVRLGILRVFLDAFRVLAMGLMQVDAIRLQFQNWDVLASLALHPDRHHSVGVSGAGRLDVNVAVSGHRDLLVDAPDLTIGGGRALDVDRVGEREHLKIFSGHTRSGHDEGDLGLALFDAHRRQVMAAWHGLVFWRGLVATDACLVELLTNRASRSVRIGGWAGTCLRTCAWEARAWERAKEARQCVDTHHDEADANHHGQQRERDAEDRWREPNRKKDPAGIA